MMNKFVFLNLVLFVLFFQSGLAQQNDSENIIKIGLLVTDQTSSEAQKAAELAVQIVNKRTDLKGKQFKLVTRSMEGPWGTGSKETVNMVFKEKVWAILGSSDGRNAHLAEQVTARTKVVFVSAWSSDPTLSQAYIPWFYNCVPNDIQQAEVLIKEIISNRNYRKISVLVDKGYDSQKALKYVKNQIQLVGNQEAFIFTLSECLNSPDAFLNKLKNNAVEAIVILGKKEKSWALLKTLKSKGLSIPIYGSISMLGSKDLGGSLHDFPSNLTVLNSGKWMKSNTLHSQSETDGSSTISSAVAAYGFDGMNVLLNAIVSSGFDRESFFETMAKTNYDGVTGKIQFDQNGNRLNTLKLVKIAN